MPTKPPKHEIEAFASRLIEAMEEAGINGVLRDKADRLGISKSFMDSLLKAEKFPSRKNSLKIAAILGVREAWLMEGIAPKRERIAHGEIDLRTTHWSAEDREALTRMWQAIEQKYNKK